MEQKSEEKVGVLEDKDTRLNPSSPQEFGFLFSPEQRARDQEKFREPLPDTCSYPKRWGRSPGGGAGHTVSPPLART